MRILLYINIRHTSDPPGAPITPMQTAAPSRAPRTPVKISHTQHALAHPHAQLVHTNAHWVPCKSAPANLSIDRPTRQLQRNTASPAEPENLRTNGRAKHFRSFPSLSSLARPPANRTIERNNLMLQKTRLIHSTDANFLPANVTLEPIWLHQFSLLHPRCQSTPAKDLNWSAHKLQPTITTPQDCSRRT